MTKRTKSLLPPERIERLILVLRGEKVLRKIGALEQRCDTQFKAVFDALREMMAPAASRRKRIGY